MVVFASGVKSIEAVDTPQRIAAIQAEVDALAAGSDTTIALFTTEERDDILEARTDIVSPCALGGGLNKDTIPKIWCVCFFFGDALLAR